MKRANFPPPVLSNSPAASSSDHFKSTLIKCASIGAFILPIKCSATSSNCNVIPEHPLSEAPHQNHSIRDSSLKTLIPATISAELTVNRESSSVYRQCKPRSHLEFEKQHNDKASKKQRPRHKRSSKRQRLHAKKSSKKRTTPKRKGQAAHSLLMATEVSPSILPSSKIQNVSSNDPEGLSGGGLFGSVAKGVTIALAATSGLSLPSSVSSTALGGSSFEPAPAPSLGRHLSLRAIGATPSMGHLFPLEPGKCSAIFNSVQVRPYPSMKVDFCNHDEFCGTMKIPLATSEAIAVKDGVRVRGLPGIAEVAIISCDHLSKRAIEDRQLEIAEPLPELPKEIQDLSAQDILVKRLYLLEGHVYEETRRIVKSDPENPKTVEVLAKEGTLESNKAELLDNDFKFYPEENIFARPNQERFAYVNVHEYDGNIYGMIRKFGEEDKPYAVGSQLLEWDHKRLREFKHAMKSHSTFKDAYEVYFPFELIDEKKVRPAFNDNFLQAKLFGIIECY